MTYPAATPEASPVPAVAPSVPAVDLRRLVAEDMERRRAGFQAAMAEAEKRWGMRLQTMARPFIDDTGAIRVEVAHSLVPIPEVPS